MNFLYLSLTFYNYQYYAILHPPLNYCYCIFTAIF